MFTRYNGGWRELDDMFAVMNKLRQQMEGAFDGGSRSDGTLWASDGWPRTNLVDAGRSLLLTAEVPGLSEKDIQLTLNQDVLNLSGERKLETPAGYSAHRQERRPVKFARSFTLPFKVNPERVSASVKNGVLTVTLEKAADAMPYQIKVTAQ